VSGKGTFTDCPSGIIQDQFLSITQLLLKIYYRHIIYIIYIFNDLLLRIFGTITILTTWRGQKYQLTVIMNWCSMTNAIIFGISGFLVDQVFLKA